MSPETEILLSNNQIKRITITGLAVVTAFLLSIPAQRLTSPAYAQVKPIEKISQSNCLVMVTFPEIEQLLKCPDLLMVKFNSGDVSLFSTLEVNNRLYVVQTTRRTDGKIETVYFKVIKGADEAYYLFKEQLKYLSDVSSLLRAVKEKQEGLL